MNPNISRSVGKLGLLVRKNIPNITTVLSAAGAIGTAYLSARAAYKSVPTIDKHKKNIEQVHANKDRFETTKEYNKEVLTVYKGTAIDLAKVYWPAAASLALTLAGIFTTNQVHRNRYLTMAGMYSAVSTAYADYRKRVEAKYGSEVENDLYHDIRREEIVTVETDKKGKETAVTSFVTTPGIKDDPTHSTLYLDANSRCWHYGRPELTYYRLIEIQKFLTELLRTRGYLFLNEVYDALEEPEIPDGQFIGWLYDPDRGETDNCVDFGLEEGSENLELFLSGKNEYVYITFNHDGTIYDKFPFYDRVRKRNDARRV